MNNEELWHEYFEQTEIRFVEWKNAFAQWKVDISNGISRRPPQRMREAMNELRMQNAYDAGEDFIIAKLRNA